MAAPDLLNYIGNFDLEVSKESLGDMFIPFAAGYFRSYKVDAPTGRKSWSLKFKALRQGVPTLGYPLFFAGFPRAPADYIRLFYDEYRVKGVKPFRILDPEENVEYYAIFTDPVRKASMFATLLWSSGLNIRSVQLAGATDTTDPESTPNPFGM